MTETELKKKVLSMIKREFPKVWCYKTADRFAAGIPDLLLCVNGHLVGIELKRPGGKPRPLQLQIIEKIRAAGGQAMWTDSVDRARHFLCDCQLL
jgi:hypothetical protein